MIKRDTIIKWDRRKEMLSHEIALNNIKGKRPFMVELCPYSEMQRFTMCFSYIGNEDYRTILDEISSWKLAFASVVGARGTTGNDVENLLKIMEKTDCVAYCVAAAIRHQRCWWWPSNEAIITIIKKVITRIGNDGVKVESILETLEEGDH